MLRFSTPGAFILCPFSLVHCTVQIQAGSLFLFGAAAPSRVGAAFAVDVAFDVGHFFFAILFKLAEHILK